MPRVAWGAAPEKIRNRLAVGHSRHLTSGGTAVAQEKKFAQNKKQDVTAWYHRNAWHNNELNLDLNN
jgi:hypothetical protein